MYLTQINPIEKIVLKTIYYLYPYPYAYIYYYYFAYMPKIKMYCLK